MIQIPDTHFAVKSDGKKDQNKWTLFKISSYSLIKNDSSKSVDFVPDVNILEGINVDGCAEARYNVL